jgi:methionyl-tRNA formyltransferase
MLTRADEKIDWYREAISIKNQIRSLAPHPAAYTLAGDKQLKIYTCRLAEPDATGTAGEVLGITPDGFLVQTGWGVLEILEVQLQGKKRMASIDFLKGFKLLPGDILG